MERKEGSGRPAMKMTDGKRRKLVQAAKDEEGVSTRKLASKFGVHHSYVSKVLKEEGLTFYVRRLQLLLHSKWNAKEHSAGNSAENFTQPS